MNWPTEAGLAAKRIANKMLSKGAPLGVVVMNVNEWHGGAHPEIVIVAYGPGAAELLAFANRHGPPEAVDREMLRDPESEDRSN